MKNKTHPEQNQNRKSWKLRLQGASLSITTKKKKERKKEKRHLGQAAQCYRSAQPLLGRSGGASTKPSNLVPSARLLSVELIKEWKFGGGKNSSVWVNIIIKIRIKNKKQTVHFTPTWKMGTSNKTLKFPSLYKLSLIILLSSHGTFNYIPSACVHLVLHM